LVIVINDNTKSVYRIEYVVVTSSGWFKGLSQKYVWSVNQWGLPFLTKKTGVINRYAPFSSATVE